MGILGTSFNATINVVEPPPPPPITVQLSISPGGPWRVGQSIRLMATVTQGGQPLPYVVVTFMARAGGSTIAVGTAETNASGEAVLNYTIPGALGCQNVEFYAVHNNVESNRISNAVNRETRFTNINYPQEVMRGQTFTVSGRLEVMQDINVWAPFAGRTVRITFGSTTVNVTTDGNGNFSASLTAPNTAGQYQLTIEFRP